MMLRLSLVLFAIALFVGCDATPRGGTEKFLRSVQRFNDGVQEGVFSSTKLSPELSEKELTPESRFRINGNPTPPIDIGGWRLEVAGIVRYPGMYTLDQVKTLSRKVE